MAATSEVKVVLTADTTKFRREMRRARRSARRVGEHESADWYARALLMLVLSHVAGAPWSAFWGAMAVLTCGVLIVCDVIDWRNARRS